MKRKLPSSVSMSLCSRIFMYRAEKVLPKIFRAGSEKPWMSYEEIEVIKGLLTYLKPRSCLEWGAGYSTIYFPKFLKGGSGWISVEHEKEWAGRIESMNKNRSVRIFFVKPNHFPWTDEYSDGAYSDLENYIDFPSGDKFDFILVDGRARRSCLEKACKILSDDGIVVLHDAERRYYQDALKSYRYQAVLSGYGKTGSELWVGSMGLDLKNVIDVDKYKILWKKYEKLGNVSIFGKKCLFKY